ncbi:hypothetical protein QEP16_16605 [Achromobacter insolitus]|uniref:hypothetical protein n=1 Tax=Achromobacter insolitus TaxID=217204 RepID=UPI00244EA913|nr:hypothetical protein [Achromobacter insolitus]MDH3064952.1 hypothetical protein [Achromobacter insolitus]
MWPNPDERNKGVSHARRSAGVANEKESVAMLAMASALTGCVVVPARPAYYRPAPVYYTPHYYYPAYPAPHYYYRGY